MMVIIIKIEKERLVFTKDNETDNTILKLLQVADNYMGKKFKYILGASIGTYLAMNGLRGIVIREREKEEIHRERIPEYKVIK